MSYKIPRVQIATREYPAKIIPLVATGMGDDNVTTVEDNKPVSGSSCVKVVRLPVRVAFKLNAYDRNVLTSVTMASIHVEF